MLGADSAVGLRERGLQQNGSQRKSDASDQSLLSQQGDDGRESRQSRSFLVSHGASKCRFAALTPPTLPYAPTHHKENVKIDAKRAVDGRDIGRRQLEPRQPQDKMAVQASRAAAPSSPRRLNIRLGPRPVARLRPPVGDALRLPVEHRGHQYISKTWALIEVMERMQGVEGLEPRRAEGLLRGANRTRGTRKNLSQRQSRHPPAQQRFELFSINEAEERPMPWDIREARTKGCPRVRLQGRQRLLPPPPHVRRPCRRRGKRGDPSQGRLPRSPEADRWHKLLNVSLYWLDQSVQARRVLQQTPKVGASFVWDMVASSALFTWVRSSTGHVGWGRDRGRSSVIKVEGSTVETYRDTFRDRLLRARRLRTLRESCFAGYEGGRSRVWSRG